MYQSFSFMCLYHLFNQTKFSVSTTQFNSCYTVCIPFSEQRIKKKQKKTQKYCVRLINMLNHVLSFLLKSSLHITCFCVCSVCFKPNPRLLHFFSSSFCCFIFIFALIFGNRLVISYMLQTYCIHFNSNLIKLIL